jgi:hydrogenase/urease accessory protein HupE
VLIDNSDDNQRISKQVTSVIFTFVRTSAQGASPLVSTLSIDFVNISINGTVVRCSDVAIPMTSASTAIQIIDIGE